MKWIQTAVALAALTGMLGMSACVGDELDEGSDSFIDDDFVPDEDNNDPFDPPNNADPNNNGPNNDGPNNDGPNNDIPDAGPPADMGIGDASMMPDVPDDPDEPDVIEEPDVPDDPDEPVPNQGWIGGPCDSAANCNFIEEPICRTEAEGYTEGMCTQACDRFCPDLDGENSVTFCISGENGGQCAARCDYDLYPNGGCREDYRCRILGRHNEPGVQQGVCVPPWWDGAPDADSLCLQAIDNAGVVWDHWNHTPTSPEGTNAICTVEDPVRVSGPIGGVTYRYFSSQTPSAMNMACPLVRSLLRLGDVLQEYNIRELLHIGTYNCRTISGRTTLSKHSFGMAIDIYGFVDNQGREYILEDHWEHDTENPTSFEAQVIYEIAQRMYEERIFNIILTPNYNAAHDNHFHVDLTEGSWFIGYDTDEQPRHIGPNNGH